MKAQTVQAQSITARVGKIAAISTLGLAATLAAMPRAEAFTLSITPNNGSSENTGASALLDFNFVQSGTSTVLNLGIRNTTDGSKGLGATAATLVGVGFDLPDNVANPAYSALTSTFTKTYFNQDATLNPYGTFDLGIRSGSGNFAGGNPTAGLTAGQSTTTRFTFANWNASTLENLFKTGFQNDSLRAVARFQQVNAGGGSDKVLGDFVPEVSTTQATPEPTTLAGMGLAGMMMSWQRRRQARQAGKRSA
jgi:hypothetical protein